MKKRELSHEDIKQLLNLSAAQLDQPTLTRLRHAREQAMAHYAVHCEEPVFARAGHTIRHTFNTHNKSRLWATTLLVAIILFSATAYWNHLAKSDTADVDIGILTGELPIHFYVD
jgi:hypothetical protein